MNVPMAFPWNNTKDTIAGGAGMTLRDYFACQALIALPHIGGGADLAFNEIAHDCYFLADAMLKERDK